MEIKKNKEFILVLANHFLDLLTTIVITKLLSVNLTKDEYGFYSLILSLLALISILPFTSLQTAIERYIVEYKEDNTYEAKYTSLISIHGVLIIFFLVVLYFTVKYVPEQWSNILFYLIIFIISRIYKALFLTIFNIERRRKIMLFARLLDMFFQITIISYYLVINKRLNIEIVLLSSIIGNSICNLILFASNLQITNFKTLSIKKFTSVFLDIFKYSIPLIFWGIFLWFQNMIGRWYVDTFMGKTDVANYSTMTSLATIPSTLIIAIVGHFVVPILYSYESSNRGIIQKTNKKLFLLVTLYWILIIGVTFYLKDFLIRFFLDVKYVNVSWSLPLLMLGMAFYSIGQVLIYEIYYYKKPAVLIFPNILPGIYSLIAGYYVIKHYNYIGAIFISITSNFLSFILTIIVVFIFSKRKRKEFINI